MPAPVFINNKLQGRRLAGKKFIPMIPGAKPGGFTLVEMMVATAILVVILVMTMQIVNYANTLILSTRKRIDAFQEARAGFEVMTRRISQAMLNTYWDYANGTVGSGTGSPQPSAVNSANNSTWFPTQYLRQSELHFLSGQAVASATQNVGVFTNSGTTAGRGGGGIPATDDYTTHCIFFQAPLGYTSSVSNSVMPNLLNPCGYFVEFSNDSPDRPLFMTTTSGTTMLPLRYRFRLKEFSVPTENNTVYSYTAAAVNNAAPAFPPNWITTPLNQTTPPKRVVAENVIALLLLPKRSPLDPPPSLASGTTSQELAPYYGYDSRAWNQTGDPIGGGQATPATVVMRNQLPSMVQVTMVAIDEASAARLNPSNGSTTMPTFTTTYTPNGLAGLFGQASSTPGTGQYDQYSTDLKNLEQALVSQHITYRVFTTNVSILQAKWSN